MTRPAILILCETEDQAEYYARSARDYMPPTVVVREIVWDPRSEDLQAYLEKTLDNVEGDEDGWDIHDVRDFIREALSILTDTRQDVDA